MTWTHGQFHWNELNTRNVEQAKNFYAATLGWSFDAMPMDGWTYWLALVDGEPVAGLFDISAPEFKRRPGKLAALYRGRRRRRAGQTGHQGRRQGDEAGLRRARRRPHRPSCSSRAAPPSAG